MPRWASDVIAVVDNNDDPNSRRWIRRIAGAVPEDQVTLTSADCIDISDTGLNAPLAPMGSGC